MGKPNIVTKQYMKDNARFADACNFFLFHGEQVIKPEDLAEKDVTELALPKGLNGAVAIEKVRDILKGCCVKTAGGVTYLIVGIENQADIHYAMVVRNMLYDALNYSSQVEACAKENRKNKEVSDAEFLSGFAKADTLHPVITLTIFWNYGAWGGARSLHEMFDVQDKAILDYVSDYKLNLIVPEEIKDFEKFKTELGPVLEFISDDGDGKRLKKALKEKEERWSVLGNEEVNLLNICLKAKLEISSDSGEGVGNKVCKGIIELQEMSKAEGKAEGEASAEARYSKLIDILCSKQQYEELQKVAASTELRKKYYEQYGIV